MLLAESQAELQSLIDLMNNWCNKYRFKINPSKSNVVHFRNPPKQRTNHVFKLYNNGPELECVENYKYLGSFLDEYLTFNKATEVLSTAANRALGGMINKFKSMREMSYRTYSKLYDSMVCPVMDYGSAVWGVKNFEKLEQVHHRAMRFFTGVHRLCPIPGFVGDMGWLDNVSRWKLERIRFWNRLVETKHDRLLKKIFLWDVDMYRHTNKSNFASHVNQICSDLNYKECFTNKQVLNLANVKQKLLECIESKWRLKAANMDKLDVYSKIKTTFGPERYLLINIDRYEKSLLSQLRYGILPLRVETGRFIGEKRNDRTCTLCNTFNIEDQMHFLFHCNFYNSQRQELFIKAREQINGWDNLTDYDKLSQMFSKMTRILAKYVKNIFLIRRSTIYK